MSSAPSPYAASGPAPAAVGSHTLLSWSHRRGGSSPPWTLDSGDGRACALGLWAGQRARRAPSVSPQGLAASKFSGQRFGVTCVVCFLSFIGRKRHVCNMYNALSFDPSRWLRSGPTIRTVGTDPARPLPHPHPTPVSRPGSAPSLRFLWGCPVSAVAGVAASGVPTLAGRVPVLPHLLLCSGVQAPEGGWTSGLFPVGAVSGALGPWPWPWLCPWLRRHSRAGGGGTGGHGSPSDLPLPLAEGPCSLRPAAPQGGGLAGTWWRSPTPMIPSLSTGTGRGFFSLARPFTAFVCRENGAVFLL